MLTSERNNDKLVPNVLHTLAVVAYSLSIPDSSAMDVPVTSKILKGN